MFWAVVITTLFVLLEVVVYAGLISAMPRAGGDYVWQSRVFHSSVGFVLGATGWWFILWLWIPIYAALCVNSFIKPILRIVGAGGSADWLRTHNGVFVASLATIALATYLVAIGMKAYATFQKWALWIGLAGIAVAGVILLFTSKAGFISAFNRESLHLYGAHNAYAATLKNSGAGMPSSMFSGTVWQTFKLIPFMCFWLLWPNWGATLYGEVRGAKDFRKNIYQMGGGLLSAAVIVHHLPVPREQDDGLQVLHGQRQRLHGRPLRLHQVDAARRRLPLADRHDRLDRQQRGLPGHPHRRHLACSCSAGGARCSSRRRA